MRSRARGGRRQRRLHNEGHLTCPAVHQVCGWERGGGGEVGEVGEGG